MKYVWEDLEKPLNCFTVMNTMMYDLNTGKCVRHFSTNTKLVMAQKCVTPECTYYRTAEAKKHQSNYAFKASAFGLPNEEAPSEPSSLLSTADKIKTSPKVDPPDDGAGRKPKVWFKKLFRRKNGRTENS